MPRRDGTGPARPGGGFGAGFGRGAGKGAGMGAGGTCLCPQCGHKVAHSRGTPCNTQKCPKCGTLMTRGS
jgi:hypothetical protein